MALLAIETSSRLLSVAALEGDRLAASYELLADYPHAVELPSAVSRVLKAAQTPLGEVEAIAVDIGPGSFTGLRIGLAFVKALAFSAKKPVIGVPSLDVLAAQIAFSSFPVCPILDAKQRNVYAALYDVTGATPVKRTDYLLAPVDEVLKRIASPTVFVGDGCALYGERIKTRCPCAQFAASELWLPRAATLGRLGQARLAQGQRDDPGALSPMYLYPPTCSVRLSDRPAGAPRRAVAAPNG